MGLALLWVWDLVRRLRIEPTPAAVLAVLITLMFYQVGFAQYQMVLFVLASYWMISSWGATRETIPIWIALACYFGWLSAFDVMLLRFIDDQIWMQEWIGLPTFLLGCLLMACIVRAVSNLEERAGHAR